MMNGRARILVIGGERATTVMKSIDNWIDAFLFSVIPIVVLAIFALYFLTLAV